VHRLRRAQSRIIYKYVSAYFNEVPMLRQLLVGEPSGDGFVLANGNAVEIFTNNFEAFEDVRSSVWFSMRLRSTAMIEAQIRTSSFTPPCCPVLQPSRAR